MRDPIREAIIDAKLRIMYYRNFDHNPIWEAHFRARPLDTTIPVPPWLLIEA